MILSIQNIKICSTSFTDNLQYILNLVNFFIRLRIYILLLTKKAFSAQSEKNEQPEPYKLKSLCLNGLNNEQLHVSCNKCCKVKRCNIQNHLEIPHGKTCICNSRCEQIILLRIIHRWPHDTEKPLKHLLKGRIKSCCATLCGMQRARLSRDNAVLAFPTLASVQLSAALELTGRSQSGGVVFAQQLLAGHVPQLDGSGNGLAQEIPFIF